MNTRDRFSPRVVWTDMPSGQLPDDDITVLVALDDGEVWPAYRSAGLWLYVTGDEIQSAEVVYWAHMPAHPDSPEAA